MPPSDLGSLRNLISFFHMAGEGFELDGSGNSLVLRFQNLWYFLIFLG